jgi:hypothetical protein
MVFSILFFKALLINEGETTRGETTQGANRIRGETEVICALVQHLSHFMHFWVGTKKQQPFYCLFLYYFISFSLF